MVSAKAVGAGAFVVLGTLLFAGVLFKIGERRMLFEDRFTVYTEFATLGQLEPGGLVRVAGLSAGEVMEIQTPDSPSRKFRVRLEVRNDLRPLIRTDSMATAQTEGLFGGTFVNIAPGTEQAPMVAEGGTIPSREPFAFANLLQQASDTIDNVNDTVTRLSDDMERTVQQIALTTGEAHRLLAGITPEVHAITRNGNRITADAQQIVEKVKAGEGTLGRLINDDSLYRRALQIVDEANAVMLNVREVTEEARQGIADLRSDAGPANGLMNDMRLTLSQAREVTSDLADNMEALKHNFLLRGYFNKRGYFDLDAISPAQYRSGVLENGKRRAMRIWLKDVVLFTRQPDGTEVLTPEGRARIDSAMSTFLRHLPSNPLIVEGYAAAGTAADQFQVARQRAARVREYLLERYGLMPQHTGFIALGGDALGSPDGNTWDGVGLTLFLDTEATPFASQPRNAGTGQAPGSPSTQ
jgi:phospholipid/cholesterol/gamma-HCH transport system substrate-binding protein